MRKVIFYGGKNPLPDTPKDNKKVNTITPPAGGKTSIKDDYDYLTSMLKGIKKIANAGFDQQLIPLIRALSKHNPDLSQAIFDLVALSNTGIEIKFDQGVDEKIALEMKRYIFDSAETWHEGCAGIHGLINKMFYQLWIGGAISNEWVPNRDLTKISRLDFLNPELVRWVRKRGYYRPYQKLRNTYSYDKNSLEGDLHPLNPYTYKYLGMVGDEDHPYGVPPMLAALKPFETQGFMLDNIKFIVQLMGFLGYVDATIEKPQQNDDESETDYTSRLNQLLEEMKARVKLGLRDGVNVGFKEDHEFNFNSTTTGTGNAEDLWQINEQQVSSGMKYDSAFLGRAYDTSETSITILFTKMLSILQNVQSIVSSNLEYGFTLALLLQGYKFGSIKVEFNKSTITDTLKYQQAEEYRIRNQRQLRMDGIIDQTQYANAVGIDKPASPEPVVPFDGNGGSAYDSELQRRKEKQDKQEQEKKKRDKNNPQGTIKKGGGKK